MRVAKSLAALVSAGMVSTASAAVTPASGVTASANAWDTRIEGHGCAPSGCVAENAVDDSIEPVSRWSCNAERSGVDACELTLAFDAPTDIVEVRIALWKGDQRTRALNIFVDGDLASNVVSSGTTEGYETYELTALQSSTVMLQAASMEDNGWLSITGVLFMVDSEVEVSPPSPAPTGDGYVGCYSDMLSDRVMTSVMTSDDLTPEACAAACAEMEDFFYGLQQGNECWCAGCDLTDNDTNTDYDRHGAGSCSVACAGDSSSTCGGDMSISLYQTGSCTVTPAPTPSVPDSECPSGSIQSSLEITLSWEVDTDLDLWVQEPGGEVVYFGQRLGDVGMMSNDQLDGPGSETFILLNGLSVTDDNVLGNYETWVTNGRDGSEWLLTARSGGELLWAVGGVAGDNSEDTRYTATVTAYTESDCSIDTYGNCPEGALSSDGLPPCVECPSGDTSYEGATFCTLGALQNLDISEELSNAIVADAVGGFAGPGFVDLDGDLSIYDRIFVSEDDAGTLQISGTFERDDEVTLPASTALFTYLIDVDTDTFVQAEGDIDYSTGEFTVEVTDVPTGLSELILSFAVLDPEDTPEDQGADTAFAVDVVNSGCGSPLTITLEWSTDNSDFDLYITEPSGNRVFPGGIGDFGYTTDDNTDGFGPETYTVFGGDESVLGEYTAQVWTGNAQTDTTWTLTANVNGEVAWVEEGLYSPQDFSFGFSDSDSLTDIFPVTVDSIGDTGC